MKHDKVPKLQGERRSKREGKAEVDLKLDSESVSEQYR
jgi:hypothetical protein